ncbi:GMC oxidoreductase [Nocardioides speluncae]|uniref:GMC oxidoreductase n=1 Tax=Nocardioides speluncae TaxID=2670337 RepID=UPI000D6992AE|nr:GMC family oxidoreductase [Nocardioides speluncae]
MTHYDVLVIGSGFGGSTTALRLTEKGYRVGVLDMGRRWAPHEFPATNWRVRRSMWAPRLGCTGPLRLTALKNCFILSAVGVGGGSLIYGNTLYDPLDAFYTDRQWAGITDWRDELAPYYDQAKRMLGVAANPRRSPADDVLLSVATDLGVAETFHATNVGVYFGEPGKTVPDPYFGGAGPDRAGCIHCAQCLTGCPHNAKNTTETNYLYLAEKAGAEIHQLTQVVDVAPLEGGGFEVQTARPDRWVRRQRRTFTADQVVFAAASLGTQRLLHQLRATGRLPHISPRLGELTRTNSEAILSASSRRRRDLAQGVSITSSIHPDPRTHIEACHWGKGSNLLYGLFTPLVDGSSRRLLRWMLQGLRHPLTLLRSLNLRGASERSVGLLVMQAVDNSITTYRTRGLFGVRMTSKQGPGDPNPSWIPVGNDVTRRMAEKLGGDPHGTLTDLVNLPVTGHFLGGCVIGESPGTGVVDPYQRLFGHPGLHVVDGSTISANLGVNPSLTITAQAERAMALWPNKGEVDPRPALGSPYRRVRPVAPKDPVVPADAPGALRLPDIEVAS